MSMKEARAFVKRWHRECNAYCRDGRHAGVLFSDAAPASVGRAIPEFIERVVGGRYLAHQPAPEAKQEGRSVTVYTNGMVVEEDERDETGWLVLWEAA